MKVYVICRQDDPPEAAFATLELAIEYAKRQGLYYGAEYEAQGGYPDIFEMDVAAKEDRTQEEREALEAAIGAGLVEIGGPTGEGDPVVRACRKLGLNPTDWQGQPMLPEIPGALDGGEER